MLLRRRNAEGKNHSTFYGPKLRITVSDAHWGLQIGYARGWVTINECPDRLKLRRSERS